MKKMMIALVAMLTFAATGKAMSYEQARNEALFLTDKMAYELNLTEEQYEAAYEINLDYLMGVTSYDDVYGTYWERRNLDLSYILLDWQLNAFRAASYFYRPLYWADGFWHFGIYARYPHRDYFYYGRPVFYASYRGGHAWHVVGGRGWYHGRRDHFIHHRPGGHFGMRDGWHRGDYRHHHNTAVRHSSTRTTMHHRDMNRHSNMDRHSNTERHRNMERQHDNNRNRDYNRYGNSHHQHNMERGSIENRPNRNITGGENRSPRSFEGYRINGSTPRSTERSGSFNRGSSSHSSGSFNRGTSSHSGGSFGGGHRSSGGGSHGSGGSHHLGGRR